ncbi:MAG: hypothetical protein K1X95_08225 [Acidimicrobiia bacterium]|nr:hypothetical protein [Acidimicrobiia bacterium]
MTVPHAPGPDRDEMALDAFFDQGDADAVADADLDAVLGRPGELEHDQFSGPRFLRVVVVAVWGVALLLAATVAWGHTRFAAPGAPRWAIAAGGAVCVGVAAWLATAVRVPYMPPAGEDPEFVELRAGFRERFVVGPADVTWALVALSPLMVLVFT